MAFIVPTLPLSGAKRNSSPQTSRTDAPRSPARSTTTTTKMAATTRSKTADLRRLLSNGDLHLMPCCYDGLSAKLIERADFDLTFMSGFTTAGAKAMPDTGLLSLADLVANVAEITSVIDIPLIADGDTGFGNPVNVRRTITQFYRAGASGVLIEDQVNPKRCGHVRGKAVVDRDEAVRRVRAAVDARDDVADGDGGPLIIARTDAARFDFDEAIARCQAFRDVGADMTFLEAPESEEDMRRYCDLVPGLKLANMLEQGDTPILPPDDLRDMGYSVAAYPLTMLSAAVRAQQAVLQALKAGRPDEVQRLLTPFDDLRDVVGFNDYHALEDKYK